MNYYLRKFIPLMMVLVASYLAGQWFGLSAAGLTAAGITVLYLVQLFRADHFIRNIFNNQNLMPREKYNVRPAAGARKTVIRYVPIEGNTREREREPREKEIYFQPREMALILIDLWHLTKPFYADDSLQTASEIMTARIAPLLRQARENNITVFHCPTGGELVINDRFKPLAGEHVVDSAEDLDRIAREKGIRCLFYAGFNTDDCILYRPCGMVNMKAKGYQTIIIRDCTATKEFKDTFTDKLSTKFAIRHIEIYFGGSVMSADLFGR